MATICNKEFNITVYEHRDNNGIRCWCILIEKFESNDKPAIGKNRVYVYVKDVYELKKALKYDIELVRLLYSYPKNKRLNFVNTWKLEAR